MKMNTRHIYLLALVLGATSPARASQSCSWQVVNPPDPSQTYNQLFATAAFDSNNVWAAGISAAMPTPQVFYFNGTQWSAVATGNLPTSSVFNSLSGTSSSNLWGVGYQQDAKGSHPFIAHWNGSVWSVVKNPAGADSGELSSVVSINETLAWAVGNVDGIYHEGPAPLIEKYDGHSWILDSYVVPSGWAIFQSVTGNGPDDVWAGGYGGDYGGALVERWNKSTSGWDEIPNTLGTYIDSISARSASDVWAVGPPTIGPLFVERWNGAKWHAARWRRKSGTALQQINATSAYGDTWLVGIRELTKATSGFVYRDAGDGAGWQDTKVIQPTKDSLLFSVIPVPGRPNNVWAVGAYENASNNSLNLAELYSCSSYPKSLHQKRSAAGML
jgi:hypothetical protein